MGVTFIEPVYLWLLLLLPLFIALGTLQGGAGRRRGLITTGLRVLAVSFLIGSLAGTQIVRPVSRLTTIFVLDASDSVSPGQRVAFETFISDALETMPQDDQAAIIVFGEDALIERTPSQDRRFSRLQSVPLVSRTNIEQAMMLSLALFPADSQKRIVLLSDGGENSGRALNVLELAQQRDVAIDVVPGADLIGEEVAVTALRLPTQARQEQELEITTSIESSSAQAATLRILVDRQVLLEEGIQLQAGTQEYTTTVVIENQGYHRISAQITPANDTRVQNNEATALVNIEGPPKVLVVANTQADGENIGPALNAAGLETTTVPPGGLPTTLAGLADYEVIVLANIPRTQLPDEQQRVLNTYVRDLGRGLVFIGGTDTYGIGGYIDAPIVDALPLDMELRNQEKYPAISVAVVFDISGSMGASVGGRQKVQLAADGAAQVAQLLRDFDEITVMPYDSQPQNTYGPVAGSEREEAQREIMARGKVGGGGITVGPALRDAGNLMRGRDFPLRHIIILADGSDSQEQEGAVELATELRREGITVSTVAIGNGGDVPFLDQVARAGGGRTFLVEDASQLPAIVLQEAQLALAPYLVEQQFTPLLGADSPVIAGLANRAWPELRGLNGTLPKDRATVVLWGPEELPLLAHWQYGLGRTVAWTSDMKGKWGADLVTWDGFPRLIAQMVGWALPTLSNNTITVDTAFIGPELEVTVRANTESGQPLTGLSTSTVLVNDTESIGQMGLVEIQPGVYRGRTFSPPAGTYFLQLRGIAPDGQIVYQQSAGVIVPYSPEYRQGQSNPALLEALAQAAAGRVLSDPARAFDHNLDLVTRATPVMFPLLLLALLLTFADIAVRRLRSLGGLVPQRAPKPVPVPVEPMLGNLSAAKNRATQRQPKADDPAPIYRAAPPPPVPQAPPQASPKPPEPAKAATPPPPPGKPAAAEQQNLEEITDPLERLRAAKNRAPRR